MDSLAIVSIIALSALTPWLAIPAANAVSSMADYIRVERRRSSLTKSYPGSKVETHSGFCFYVAGGALYWDHVSRSFTGKYNDWSSTSIIDSVDDYIIHNDIIYILTSSGELKFVRMVHCRNDSNYRYGQPPIKTVELNFDVRSIRVEDNNLIAVGDKWESFVIVIEELSEFSRDKIIVTDQDGKTGLLKSEIVSKK